MGAGISSGACAGIGACAGVSASAGAGARASNVPSSSTQTHLLHNHHQRIHSIGASVSINANVLAPAPA